MYQVLDADPKGLAFDDALKLLKGGRVIRRAGWEKDQWLEMSHSNSITVCRPYGHRQVWISSQEDILAEDWEAHESKSLGQFAFEVYSKHMGMGNSTQWPEVNDHTKSVFRALADEMTEHVKAGHG